MCKLSTTYKHVQLPDDSVLYTLAAAEAEGMDADILRPAVDSLMVFPDTLPMPLKYDALMQRAMLLKQISSCGVRTWLRGDRKPTNGRESVTVVFVTARRILPSPLGAGGADRRDRNRQIQTDTVLELVISNGRR